MTDEIKNLHELITNVRLDIRELNTKMDGIKDLTKKVEDVKETADSALDSTKSAHHRLDAHDKIIFWVSTTIIGALILAAVVFAIKGGLSK